MRCVGAIITNDRGELLLIRRGRPPGEGLWSLPGGRVEPGETDAQALTRELKEETGLDVVAALLAGTVWREPYEIHDYFATVSGGSLQAGDDASDVIWAPIDELAVWELTDGLLEFLNGHLR